MSEVEQGISLNVALYEACASDRWDSIDEHLQKGADPTWNHPRHGKSVIHLAAEKGQLSPLKAFCAISPAYASLRDSLGETPLHKAASEGKLDVCKYFCDTLSVDPNLRNSTLQTAIDLAVEGFYTETAHYLSAHIQTKRESLSGSLWNIGDLISRNLYGRVAEGDLEAVRELLSRKADPCWSNPHHEAFGKTAIHIASEKGYLDILKLLLTQVPNMAEIRDSRGETPLHTAAAEGRLEICQYLVLDMKVDPNLRNATLQTATDLSLETEFAELQEFLSVASANAYKHH